MAVIRHLSSHQENSNYSDTNRSEVLNSKNLICSFKYI